MHGPSYLLTPRRKARQRGGERRAAARLLVMCARGDGAFDTNTADRLLRATYPSTVVALATFHRVGGLTYERLRSLPDVSAVLLDHLRAQFDASMVHHQRTLRNLARLQPILDSTGVPWAVMKGPTAVELLYGAAGRRPYRDLDILVRPSGFGEALGAVEAEGARVVEPNWRKLRREMRGEVHLVLPDGGALDLHWDLIESVNGAMRIDTDEVLRRAVPIDVGTLSVRTLDDADRAIHFAVHAALSGGNRLGWLKDLERVAGVAPPDWDELVDRARRWHVAAPTGLLLSRARLALGADIPARIIRQLLGARTARLVQAIDRRWPPERASSRLTPARLVAHVLGRGLAGATALTVRRVVARGLPRTSPLPSWPGGAEADRAAFVRAVSRVNAEKR